jgi:hypothetical protein
LKIYGQEGERHMVAIIAALCGLLGVILVLATQGHCATSAPRRTSDLGAVAYLENPNAYIMGAIKTADIIVEKSGGRTRFATNISFAPAYTFLLYNPETILFCGNRARDFNGQTGVIVVTYRKQAHEIVSGVACHDLEAVDKIADKELP